jgi:peptidoglycan/LPS O-acetylase OafA/YrhL
MTVAAHSRPASRRDTGGSVALDALRALAALLVVVDHILHLLFLEQWQNPHYAAHPLRTRILYAPFRLGPQAVVIFFVLSGYLVGGSVLRAIDRERWSWRDYLTRRMVRLWLVLIPALVLCALWQCLRQLPPTHAWLVSNDVSARVFLGNLAFLQEIRVPNFGGNRVLWTLANEFWYYLLFPSMLLVFRARSVLARAGYSLLTLGLAAFVGHAVLSLYPVWLMGALLAWLPRHSSTARARWCGLAVYVALVYVSDVILWTSHIVKMDYVVGLLTMAMLWLLRGWGEVVPRGEPWARASVWLAGLSYSLYLVHYPLLQFAADHLTHGVPWSATLPHVVCGAGLLLATVLYAALVAAVTERRNDQVRGWVEAHLP